MDASFWALLEDDTTGDLAFDCDPDPDRDELEEPEGWQALTAAERNPSLCLQ